jgi:hypothetical protein
MTEPDLFEEMLATCPAEKRELAREVYHRFADGDSTQFFQTYRRMKRWDHRF